MFHFFKKEKEEFKIVAPVDGNLILLENVPDEMFSQKIMGDGFAVDPENGSVVAPISGVAETVFPTGHAVGIKSKEGVECIVHIGLETVELNGEGFTPLIKQGDKVKAGQPIVKFDKALVEEKGYKLVTMVVFPDGYDQEFALGERKVSAGEKLV